MSDFDVKCNGCSGRIVDEDVKGVGRCEGCGGVHSTRPIYRGDVSNYVKEEWMRGHSDDWVYFDLEFINGDKVGRSHGWMDRETKRVVQTG